MERNPGDIFTKSDIRNRLLTLRSSNILMGSDGRHMVTSKEDSFVDKTRDNYRLNNKENPPAVFAKSNNVHLGSADGVWNTTHGANYYNKHCIDKDAAAMMKKNAKDLRCKFFRNC